MPPAGAVFPQRQDVTHCGFVTLSGIAGTPPAMKIGYYTVQEAAEAVDMPSRQGG